MSPILFLFQTFLLFWMLYAFFWVIPRRLNFIYRRFRTLRLFHLHRRIGVELSAYEDGTECSKTSAYKIETSGIHPEESIQQSYPCWMLLLPQQIHVLSLQISITQCRRGHSFSFILVCTGTVRNGQRFAQRRPIWRKMYRIHVAVV
jgi:hypothetical protein